MRNEGLTKNIMFSMQPALLYSSLVMSLSIVFNIISVSRLRRAVCLCWRKLIEGL